MTRRLRGVILFCVIAGVAGPVFAITPGEPFPVRILYDNSGSMYPGYRPPGVEGRRSRDQLGVHFVHQSPEFERWLGDFVQRQTLVGGGTVGMWTFTSDAQFLPTDIRQVHRAVPIDGFDPASAIANYPEHTGKSTYLTEALTEFSRGFTGLVWLITDNIVETGGGQPDAGVQSFFEVLSGRPEIRSVHLFKYSLEEGGQTAVLAVYGILVSPSAFPSTQLTELDDRFRSFGDAKRTRGSPPADLFTGRQYLKLKDLTVGVVTADLRMEVPEKDQETFKEGQSVQLGVEGQIRSRLTHHTVTRGRYQLAISSPFVPETWAQHELGAQPFTTQMFANAAGEIVTEIPPNGTHGIELKLQSNEPVSFSPRGIAAWFRLAWSGATVRYNGTARMSFDDVKVRLEPERMAGIFGIGHAPSAFRFQNVGTLAHVVPIDVPVSFVLRADSSRTWILLGLLAVIAVILGIVAFILGRKRAFRITISNGPETIAALRSLGSHNVMLDGKLLGKLSRGLLSSYEFRAVGGNPEFNVVPGTEADTWAVRFNGGATRRLTIKAEGGGTVKPQKPSPSAARAAPPPPPPPSRNAPPPPPRIGRR